MHTRNQNEPPVIPEHKISRNPSNKNGVLDDVQLNNRRKIGGGKMASQATGTRSRPPLSAVNALPESNSAVPASESSNGDSTGDQLEFKSRGDVEKPLVEKLNPKNRNNEKGSNMELWENIKKFRACVNWYMQLEDGYLAELEKLRRLLGSE